MNLPDFNPSPLRKTALFLILLQFFALLPLLASTAQAAAGPCLTYNGQIEDALANCDFPTLLEIEHMLEKKGLTCGQELLNQVKCQYFFDCALPALNQAYTDCDLAAILRIEEMILANLGDCLEYKNIKEKILGMKCLYFDACLKKEMEQALSNCDLDKMSQIEQFMQSKIMKDCPDYRDMMAVLREYKCNIFNRCLAKELQDAGRACNLEEVLEVDNTLREHFADCPDFRRMERRVIQAKCNYGMSCARKLEAEFTSSGCESNKLQKLKRWLPLEKLKDCDFRQYEATKNFYQRMECGHLNNCADSEIKDKKETCDLEGLLQIEELLYDCRLERRLSQAIKTSKLQILKLCLRKRLNQAVQNCDLEAIQQWEKFLTSKTLQDYPHREDLEQMVSDSKYDYFNRCLGSKLRSGVEQCNLELIHRTGESIRDSLAGHSRQQQMLNQVKDSECLYFVNCTQRGLEEAVENCNYEQVKKLRVLSKQEEIKNCPGYERAEAEIPEAQQLYFYTCAQKELYQAYENCDWQGIKRVEKMVEEDLKFYSDYGKIRVLLLEVKCSYFMSCLDKELEKAITMKDKVKIKAFAELINQEFAACPNYPTLQRIIREALEKIQ